MELYTFNLAYTGPGFDKLLLWSNPFPNTDDHGIQLAAISDLYLKCVNFLWYDHVDTCRSEWFLWLWELVIACF